MKKNCCLCGERIHQDDFFMDHGQGTMCSACLVGLETPTMDISSLFREKRFSERPKEEPTEQIVLDAVLAIS